MADKVTTKKAAPKKVVKATEVQTVEQLSDSLQGKQADHLEQRRSHAAGELVNPRVLRTTRKEIARLHTAIRAAELTAQKESN